MTRVLLAAAIVASMLPTAASFTFSPQPFSGSARGLNGHNSRLLMSPVPRLMSGQAGDNGGNSADMQDAMKRSVVTCPEAVSDYKLRILLLSMRLKVALRQERYKLASSLKGEIESLRARDTEVLVTKLFNVSKLMKDDLDRKRRGSSEARMREELEEAVAEQDFSRAKNLSDALKQEAGLSRLGSALLNVSQSGSPSLFLHCIELAWLESELLSSVNMLRANHEAMMRDEVMRLEYELSRAIDGQDYERAKVLQHELQQCLNIRQIKAMMRELKRALHSYKAKLLEIAKNPEKLLQYRMESALNAEDYEEAALLRNQLANYEVERMHNILQQKLKEAQEVINRRREIREMTARQTLASLSNTLTRAGKQDSAPESIKLVSGGVQDSLTVPEQERLQSILVGSIGILGLAGITWAGALLTAVAMSLKF